MKLTVDQTEAAAMLSVSPNCFKKHVRPQLRAVQVGRRTLFRVTELQQWLDKQAA